MAVSYDYELYVDGTRVFYSNSSFNIYCGVDQFADMSGSATGSYTYDEGQYVGWTTIQGSTTPEYAYGGQSPVSDVIQVRGKMYLYSIAAPSTVNIVLGNNTLTGVDTIKLTDANDTTNTVAFVYGTTPSGSVSVKLGENTLTGVNEISVMGTDNVAKSFGYASSYEITITCPSGSYSTYFEIYDGTDTTGTLLGELNDTAATFTCTTGHIYMELQSRGGYAAIIMSADATSSTNADINSMNYHSILLDVTGTPASIVIACDYD